MAVTALLSLPASPLYPAVQMRAASFWPGKIPRFDMRSEITGVDYTILVKVPAGPVPESG